MPRSFLVKKTERRWSPTSLTTTERWSIGPDDHRRLTTSGLRDLGPSVVPIATNSILGGPFFGLTSSSDGDDTLCRYAVSDDKGSTQSSFYGYVVVSGAPSPLGRDPDVSGSDETDQSDSDQRISSHEGPEAEVSDTTTDVSDISQDSVDVPSRKDLTTTKTKTKKTSPKELFPPSRPTVRHYSFDAFTDGRFKKSSSSSSSSLSSKFCPQVSGGATRSEEVPSYSCDDCGRHYATSSNLSRHRQTHRSLDSQHAKQCPHCRKVYVSMPALAMHVLTHDLKYRCTVCAKAFSRPWLLRGHLRSHTGEKPFGCAHCGKAFADRSNLRAHMQTHSTMKHFRCHRCDKSFALKSYLNKHHELACGQEERLND